MASRTDSGSSSGKWIRATVALGIAFVATSMSAWALPVYQNGTGGISFGVSGYGAPVPGVPTYIANNFTLRNDILTSPGGTFQTANPILANNISSSGIQPLPLGGFWVGGGNINGPFGSGRIVETGTAYGFALRDPVAGGGSASYALGSMISNFTNPVAYNGPWGGYLAAGGRLPAVGSAGVVALRSYVKSANPASPFFVGIDMPELILAASRNGPALYSTVARGGAGGANAIVQVTNPALGFFRGLAVNNLGNIDIPAGDAFTVTSTLTVYADPSEMDMFDLTDVNDLIPLTNTTIPDWVVAENTQIFVPEPATLTLVAMGVLLGLGRRRRD